MTPEQWAVWIHDTFPATWGGRLAPAQPVLIPYRERIEAALETNHATTVWQRLCDDTGLTVSLSTFRRYCGTLARPPQPRDVTAWRGSVEPGDRGASGLWEKGGAGWIRRPIRRGSCMRLS
jgi:hypothetical protein